jgi:hypothetical protein
MQTPRKPLHSMTQCHIPSKNVNSILTFNFKRSYNYGCLPQHISRPATNFWSIGIAKQALANQRGPWQCQRPLSRVPLIADKDVAYTTLVSQSVSQHHQCLLPYGRLMVTLLLKKEDRHCEHKPACCGWRFTSIHQAPPALELWPSSGPHSISPATAHSACLLVWVLFF